MIVYSITISERPKLRKRWRVKIKDHETGKTGQATDENPAMAWYEAEKAVGTQINFINDDAANWDEDEDHG